VDFSASVDDAFLTQLGLEKGSRKLIGHEERSEVLRRLDGESYACNAGGSLSNTLVALSRLGAAAGTPLPVGLAGSVGGDALGDFYRSKMRRAGVDFVSEPQPDGTTGTVVVLTTPDAQRTMLSFLGTSAEVRCSAALAAAAGASQLLVIEGYLLEQQDTVAAICEAAAAARDGGALVALTCADVGVVRAHGAAFRAVLDAGVDVLFANAAEAAQLAGVTEAADAAAALAACVSMAVVTDGSRGAHLATAAGGVTHVPAHWAAAAPVDTCGAGDAYAAGVLYSLLRGASLQHSGAFGARVASAVISKHGARLCEEDATNLSAVFEVAMQKRQLGR
jgi:sugar/nucleoside kinase (ribokinase family)